ncbi:hypothetical protein ACTXLB_11835 [Brachybacterium tyrofermentans]|uniref:hypothetical protein n=1 Tax=Brachybacterium tyrofermentans TaxID=47848 RepID=UPI003FD02960
MFDVEMIDFMRHGVPILQGIALLGFAVTVLGALMRGVAGLISLVRSYRLASTTGLAAEGRVVSSSEHRSRLPGGFERRMVETIAFTTQSGVAVQGEAAHADIGMEDRTGQTVALRYDGQDPTRFVAPTDSGDAVEMLWGPRAQQLGKQLAVGVIGLLIVVWAARLLLGIL